jgi:hypothetical protein
MKQSCDSLSSRVQLLNSQAISANASGGNGDLCNQVTQAQQQSVDSPSALNATNTQNSYATAGVAAPLNPATDGVQARTNADGKAGFQASVKDSKSDDYSVFPTSYSDTNSSLKSALAGQASAHPIPNNSSGSSIPRGNGPGLGAKPNAGTVVNPSGATSTDVLEAGTRSGGGISYGGVDPPSNGNRFANRSPSGGRNENSGLFGLDLKKYLPNWLSSRLPSGMNKQLSKTEPRSRYCLEGGLVACDLETAFPRTMGYLDGEILPTEAYETFERSPWLTAMALFVAFGSVTWAVVKWQLIKPLALGLLGPRLTVPSAKQERRKQSRPVENNRRVSSAHSKSN